MQELRFVAVSEDGSYAVLAVPGRSGRYILPIDERLRAVALGQASRLAQYEIEVESPLRPKEIQARIRAGETAEEIADAAGIPVERVRWFEGPVLAERAYIADQAQTGSVRRAGDGAGPGPRLGDIVTERLNAAGTDPTDGQWDSRKRGDGNWQVSLTFPSAGRLHVAEWVFDPRRRHVMPDDDNAARLSLPESDLPAEPVPVPGEATVTPIASRLAPAAGMGGAPVGGNGASAFPGTARFRPDKSVLPDRSLGMDRSLVERPASMPDRAASGRSDRTPAPPAPAAPARGGQHSGGQQERPSRPAAQPGYAEFPESAPYRAPEPPDTRPRDTQPPAGAPPAYQDYDYREPVQPRQAYREPLGFRASTSQAPAAEPPVAPAFDGPEFNDAALATTGRAMADPPRRIVFEDPEPGYFDEDPAPALDLARPAAAPQAPATATVPATAPARAPESVRPEHALEPQRLAQPDDDQGTDDAWTVSEAPEAERTPSADAATESAAAPAAPAAAPAAPLKAATPPPAPDEPKAAPEPEREPKETAPVPAEPKAAPAPDPAATAAAEPAAAQEPELHPEPEASPAAAEDQPASRRGAKKNAKARRSSVPSWDEIMLGSSRQRD